MIKSLHIRTPEEGPQPVHVFKADFSLFHRQMLIDFTEYWSAQTDEAQFPRKLTYEEWLEQYHAFVEIRLMEERKADANDVSD